MAFVFLVLVLVLNEMALVLEESNGFWDVAYEYDYEHRVLLSTVLLSSRNPDFPTIEYLKNLNWAL